MIPAMTYCYSESAISLEVGTSKSWQWLISGTSFDRYVDGRPGYDWVTDQLVRAVDDDPAWQAWWAGSGVPDLELYPFYTGGPIEAPQVSRGRQIVRLEHSFDAARLLPTDHPTVRRFATEDLIAMLETLRAELGLAALPALPPIPAIPADLPAHYLPLAEAGAGAEEMLSR